MGITKVVKKIVLNSSVAYRKYVSPHNLDLSVGDSIEFEALKSDFEVLIHNKDRFFDTNEVTLAYIIPAGKSEQTPAIKAGLAEGTEKYYSVYCVNNNDFADKPGSSPPRIVVIP